MSGPPPASSTMSGPPPAGRAVSVIAAGARLRPTRGRRTCSPRRYAAARGRQRRRGDEPPRSKAVTIAMLVVAAVLVLGVVRAGAAYLSLRGASGSGQDPDRRRCRRGRAPRPGGLAEDEPVPDGIEV